MIRNAPDCDRSPKYGSSGLSRLYVEARLTFPGEIFFLIKTGLFYTIRINMDLL